MQSEIDESKLCLNCSHHYEQWSTSIVGGGRIKESDRCRVKAVNPVHGGKGDPDCLLSRMSPYLCGPKARFYEAA